MPESAPSALDQAEQQVSQGKLKQALDRLQSAVRRGSGLYRDAVSLRSRLHTLNRQVTQGVIDREDETLERSRIVQGVLDLIEQAKSQEAAATGAASAGPPTPWQRRRWVYGVIGVGVLVAIVWGVLTLQPRFGGAAASPARGFDLELDLRVVPPGGIEIPGSTISAKLGDLSLPLKHWEPGGKLVYPALDAAYRADTLQIELTDWPYRYSVRTLEDRFSAATRRVSLGLHSESESFAGVITTPTGIPVSGVELIFDGRFRVETDGRGRYEIELPLRTDQRIRLEIRRGGRVLEEERKFGQRADILDTVEVRLPAS